MHQPATKPATKAATKSGPGPGTTSAAGLAPEPGSPSASERADGRAAEPAAGALPASRLRAPRRAHAPRAVAAALLVASLGPAARAQLPPPAGGPPGPAGPGNRANQVDQARVHYERGMQLFNEDNFEAALNEFERAYELAPSYRILYNMARIQRQQNNYAAALQNFQGFLAEGGAAVGDERRREVERDIEVLRARVASVDVKVNVEGADLFVDDVPVCAGVQGQRGCVSKSPLLAPLFINPGRRKISAVKAGYSAASAMVRVVGSDRTSVRLDLQPAGAGVAATSSVDVEGGGSNAGALAIATWLGAGAFAVAAGVTGVLTLKAQSDLRDRREQYVGDDAALDGDARKVKNFALATDVLGGIAVVGAVAATIFTIRASGSDEPARADQGARLRFDFGPGGASLSGRF